MAVTAWSSVLKRTAFITIVLRTFPARTGSIRPSCFVPPTKAQSKMLSDSRNSVASVQKNSILCKVFFSADSRAIWIASDLLSREKTFLASLGEGNRDFARTTANLKYGICTTESQLEQGDGHNLILGWTSGKYCPGHLLNFGCGKVLMLFIP